MSLYRHVAAKEPFQRLHQHQGKDLGLSDDQYQWLLTIFYIPYIVFEWTALMWKAVPPHRWAFACVLVWGTASTLQAAAYNWSGLLASRFFLATAEAAFAPGIPYLLSFFYKRNELGVRCGFYVSAAPLATTFAGALAYGITSGHPAIANWRLLFIVEGVPSVLLAFVAFWYMPDSADTAHFLTEDERQVAKARAVQQTGSEGSARIGHVNLKETFHVLKDIKTWIPPLMYFSCNVSYSSLPVFLPFILQNMGFTAVNAQGLSAPPYLLAFIVCVTTAWVADRTQQRGAGETRERHTIMALYAYLRKQAHARNSKTAGTASVSTEPPDTFVDSFEMSKAVWDFPAQQRVDSGLRQGWARSASWNRARIASHGTLGKG
ncbi:hypothetical protein NUW58_g8140 [Xylaria curta]|uniref:Uncharacterized protein n=1 Tax=Xylaria curta TaxID=42375 RepID=A0ACC1NBQ5_9PEZI|nr:hypothetical protein NUW58_g8140 [Xylaria curta]